jgi:hypothetical protein
MKKTSCFIHSKKLTEIKRYFFVNIAVKVISQGRM